MPWIEDQYLYYFGKDNKASYATKGAVPDNWSDNHFISQLTQTPQTPSIRPKSQASSP